MSQHLAPLDRHTHDLVIRPIDHHPFRRLLRAGKSAGRGPALRARPQVVLDAEISDAAFRAYSLLLRHGDTCGQRMRRVACGLSGCTVLDAVDRAVREVADAGPDNEHDGRGDTIRRNRLCGLAAARQGGVDYRCCATGTNHDRAPLLAGCVQRHVSQRLINSPTLARSETRSAGTAHQ